MGRMAKSVLAGLMGRKRVECAYVMSDITDLPYFASKVVFGEAGVVKVLDIGTLNEHETARLEEAKTALKKEIESGLEYAKTNELWVAGKFTWHAVLPTDHVHSIWVCF